MLIHDVWNIYQNSWPSKSSLLSLYEWTMMLPLKLCKKIKIMCQLNVYSVIVNGLGHEISTHPVNIFYLFLYFLFFILFYFFFFNLKRFRYSDSKFPKTFLSNFITKKVWIPEAFYMYREHFSCFVLFVCLFVCF